MERMEDEQKRILIVEDDPEMRSLLKDFMEEEGFRVEAAQNGFDAFGKLSHAAFDLVITDIRMPGVSGLDILPVLRKIQPNVSVVVITAFGNGDVCRKAIGRGAAGYLEKPIRLEKLKKIIHSIVYPLEKI